MKQVFEVAGAMIFSLGGGAAIVFALSSWLGKVWANRILEKEKAEHSKEIEYYKSELNKELNRINAMQDKALHISKGQYDYEYKIYQEIWGALQNIIRMIENISFPRIYNAEDFKLKYKKIYKKCKKFEFKINKYSLFYQEQFINELYKILTLAVSFCTDIKKLEVKNSMIEINDDISNQLFLKQDIIQGQSNDLKVLIKTYLHSLILNE